MGTRHRLEGLLLNSKRGLVLQIDDGGVWALDHDRHAAKLIGLRVVVEGTRSGVDRMSTISALRADERPPALAWADPGLPFAANCEATA